MNTNQSLGQKIGALRRQNGLSQRDLAAAVGRSESWMSQVERDVQPVERLSVLKTLAAALGVEVADLRPDASTSQSTGGVEDLSHDIEAVQLVLSGHPAISHLWQPDDPEQDVDAEFDSCKRAVEHAQKLLHSSRFTDLGAILVDLIPRLERLVRTPGNTADATRLDNSHLLRSRVYQITAASFARQDETAAAWVAADRAIAAAEQGRAPLEVVASQYRLAHILIRLKRYAQSEHVIAESLAAIRPLTADADDTPAAEVLSLEGALHLTMAILHAREGNRVSSHSELDKADDVAGRIGADRNDFGTEFGPTNVLLHKVAVAIDFADAGEALEVASRIDTSALSNERRARLLIDLARAHSQCRQADEALADLLEADQLAPEMVRGHHHVRTVLADLLARGGRNPNAALRTLAKHAGV